MFNRDPRGQGYFGRVAGRKQGLNALASDAQVLCRITGQGREGKGRQLVPHPEETRGKSPVPAFLTIGNIFLGCLRITSPAYLENATGNDGFVRAW